MPARAIRILVVTAGIAVFAALLGPRARVHAMENVTCEPITTVGMTCQIDQPNVRQRLTDYREVRFSGGDLVFIHAIGCVQTGGTGDTWKLYVFPKGPQSDRLYHGLILIPGLTIQAVRIADIVDQPLVVPESVEPINAFLRLGYEDDDYSDNGYYDHDDGTGDQCKGIGPARVTISILHNTNSGAHPSEPPAPMDLVWNSLDRNSIPLNPDWGWHKVHGSFPEAGPVCDNFEFIGFPHVTSISLGSPPCTRQPLQFDQAQGLGYASPVCTWWNTRWQGHVNWLPGTYLGNTTWEEHSPPGTDDDYNFRFATVDNAGLTAADAGARSIEIEFDSDETIDNFHSPWWSRFHTAVDISHVAALSMADHRKASVTGLVGLDCRHGCKSEVHPVWGFALSVAPNPLVTGQVPGEDDWAFFMRNWGNEGFCSSQDHLLDVPNNVMWLHIIPPLAATDFRLLPCDQCIYSNTSRIKELRVFFKPCIGLDSGECGLFVLAQLPAPEDHPLVNGLLRLVWLDERDQTISTINRRSTGSQQSRELRKVEEVESDSAERAFESLISSLSASQRQEIAAADTNAVQMASVPISISRIEAAPSAQARLATTRVQFALEKSRRSAQIESALNKTVRQSQIPKRIADIRPRALNLLLLSSSANSRPEERRLEERRSDGSVPALVLWSCGAVLVIGLFALVIWRIRRTTYTDGQQ
jgi:hypothetical protein